MTTMTEIQTTQVYQVFIVASPEHIWEAITNPEFTQQYSVGQKKSLLQRLDARESARSFYRIADSKTAGARPSVNYSRADHIVLTMETGAGDSLKVRRVDMSGHVDGVQLEPAVALKADSTKPKKP